MNPQRHTPMDPAEMRKGSAVRLPPRGTRPGANASSPAMQGRVRPGRGRRPASLHPCNQSRPVLKFHSSFSPRDITAAMPADQPWGNPVASALQGIPGQTFLAKKNRASGTRQKRRNNQSEATRTWSRKSKH